jgi:O-methyltransferase involved in polyketide biosynthesis
MFGMSGPEAVSRFRAYRLPLPTDVRLFEVDLPELRAFREPVLAAAQANPRCMRRVVVADLRENWAKGR